MVAVRYAVCLNAGVHEALPVYPNLLDRDDLTAMVWGRGGREHALAWMLNQSGIVRQVLVAPGNGGTSAWNVNCPGDVRSGIRCAVEHEVDFVVVGPDQALADGMVDQLAMRGIAAFGPTRRAAKIEWWKPYGKKLMQDTGIPTADFKTFRKPETAHRYLAKHGLPAVLKAAGLALGKGVSVSDDPKEAHEFIDRVMTSRTFGDAGRELVIEDLVDNEDGTPALEFSLIGIAGRNGEQRLFLPFISSQDYKQAYDGDQGPNTGGMGTIAPVTWLPQSKINKLARIYIDPGLDLLAQRGIEYRGVDYAGIMGNKKLEDNARYGDPETQVYVRQMKSDLAAITVETLANQLGNTPLEWHDGHTICVVAAAQGYPHDYQKGQKIGGLEAAAEVDGVVVFHAGTAEQDGDFYTNGGRVLNITATGKTPEQANRRAYAAIQHITFDGSPDNVHYRTDIGKRPPPVNFVV